MNHTPEHCEACDGLGLLLTQNDHHGLRIERCDACEHYVSDEAAVIQTHACAVACRGMRDPEQEIERLINPLDLENRLSVFHDTKKKLLYFKTGGWGWCDRDEADNRDAWHVGFETAWDAILAATEPYFEESE